MQSRWALRKLGYKVLGDIGKGSYGQVKLATSKMHPDEVAIKIMDGKSKSPKFTDVFLPRELDILRRVKHPNIIEVYDIHVMPNKKVFIVMEAAAMNLYQKVKEVGALPADQARTLFSQIVSAVSYLHQQHIVHRDLKSKNVLLTADGQVKLTDFGLSCRTSGYPQLRSSFYGTLEYVPPELLMHQPYDGKKNDVWSLGVILYFMVTGRLPFKRYKGKVTVLDLQLEGVRFPPEMPIEEPCRKLITHMLCFSPKRRPSIAEVQQDPWLQSVPEQETSETADLSGMDAESPLDQTVLETAGEPSERKTEDQEQQQDDLKEEEALETSEKSSPVIDRPAGTADEDEDERRSSASSPDITALEAVEEAPRSSSSERNDVEELPAKSCRCESEQEAVGSKIGASRTHRGVEDVGEEDAGCIGCCSSLFTAAKSTAKKYVAAPILKTTRAL